MEHPIRGSSGLSRQALGPVSVEDYVVSIAIDLYSYEVPSVGAPVRLDFI